MNPNDKIVKLLGRDGATVADVILFGSVGGLAVTILDGTGTPITSFGGGTQYTNAGVAAANPVGTGIIFNNAGTYAFVSAANPLPVSATISTAGLATSAKQDTQTTSLQLIDDAVYTTGVGTPGAGFLILGSDGTNPRALRTDSSGFLSTVVGDGSNVTLGAKADAKSTATDTTAITIMSVLKQISASVQAPPSQAVTNGGTFAAQITTINSVAPAFGTGTRSASVQRVTIATDDLVPVSLAAETTKVIGVTRTADGAGNLLTTNSTTYTAKFAVDSNILGTLGTAFSTAGKVDVKAADGDVFVRQATASNLNATVVQATGTNLHMVVDSGTVTTVSTVTTVTTVSTVTNLATIGTSVTPGTSAAHLGKAEDAVHGSGDTGVAVWGVANEAQTSLAADGDYIGMARDIKGNSLTVGNLAHDAADAGFPLKVGGQARTTNPAAVADADRSNFITDKLGKQVVVGSIRDLKTDATLTLTTTTTETSLLAASASTFNDLYGLIVVNTSVTAAEISFRDVLAGSVRFTIYVPAGETRGFMLPESAAWKQATVNTAWTAQSSASVTSIKIHALFVKNI